MDIYRDKNRYYQAKHVLEGVESYTPQMIDDAKDYIEGYDLAMVTRRTDLIDYEMRTHGAAESIASTIVDSYLASIEW